MPRSEIENEYYTGEEYFPTAPELTESSEFSPSDNEYVPRQEKDTAVSDTKQHDARKKARHKRNFLLQAAAVIVGVVLVTSSFGEDILHGSGTSSDLLTEVLERIGAKKGVITVSMIWETSDDIDLHVVTPSGTEIYYSNPTGPGGGELDVDMQVETIVEHPVENVYFTDPEQGDYRVMIVNYSDREPGDPEVLVRVEVRGKVKEYRVTLDDYSKEVCKFTYGR